MLIGEVGTRSGTSARTLRFYEREGLLADPPRTSGGYRDYPESVLDRVGFIKDAQAAGFTLAQVREILEIRDAGEAPCAHVEQLVDQRLAEVEQRLKELRAVRSHLRQVAAEARRLDPADCDGYCGLIPEREAAPTAR